MSFSEHAGHAVPRQDSVIRYGLVMNPHDAKAVDEMAAQESSSGLTRARDYLRNEHNVYPPRADALKEWASLWSDSRRDVADKASIEKLIFDSLGCYPNRREDVLRFIDGLLEARSFLEECGTSIEHLAEPGDLHCQRCGKELSIEDGVRINEKYWETDTLPEGEQRTETQRRAWSDVPVTKQYVEEMDKGSWQDDGPGPITVDPDATLFDYKLHYDTILLLPRFRFPHVTASRAQLGLPPADVEPDTFAVVALPEGWWGLRNTRTDTVVLKIHGPGAKEDITDQWNAKTAVWLAWKGRQRE